MKNDLALDPVLTEVKAELFKCMGHPSRIRLLEMLVDGPVAVSRLREVTGLEPSNLSQHLGMLRRQRLIVPSRRDGRLFYELSSSEVVGLLTSARAFLGTVQQRSGLVFLPDDAVPVGSGYGLAAEA
ncbi:MAG: transcriptional regulator, ArsR family [Arthrobacter sp.]|nr:transcriptional regulator, ArsR family [Arthrobacter sp.]